MTTVPNDLMQDWTEIELACSECGERWLVHVPDSESLREDQVRCACGGEGTEC